MGILKNKTGIEERLRKMLHHDSNLRGLRVSIDENDHIVLRGSVYSVRDLQEATLLLSMQGLGPKDRVVVIKHDDVIIRSQESEKEYKSYLRDVASPLTCKTVRESLLPLALGDDSFRDLFRDHQILVHIEGCQSCRAVYYAIEDAFAISASDTPPSPPTNTPDSPRTSPRSDGRDTGTSPRERAEGR